MCPPSVLLRNADLGSGSGVDVLVHNGRVTAIGTVEEAVDAEINCEGGALLPGLHDHHLHLLAVAAAAESVQCGVRSRNDLGHALRSAAPRDGWVRGVGYDDGLLGDLDRASLDEMRPDVPVRVQHRSGALWVLNSAAVAALALADVDLDGVERDATGRPTGRLWRVDGWLRDRLPAAPPDLGRLGQQLNAYGLTGVTDATPCLSDGSIRLLGDAGLAQRVVLLGDPSGSGPWKVVVADHDLPCPDELRATIAQVRPRAVALHCVTRAALVVAVAALREGGAVPGDRIEHAAVCPPELAAAIGELGVTVVTQPSLVARRGDEYLDRVDPPDTEYLWPFASLLAAGVPVGCSSDAPYGDLDPWRTIAAAADRTTASGRVVASAECVSPARALAGFLTIPDAPGGPVRTVHTGVPADLVLLDRPLTDALRAPAAEHVRMTMIDGRVVHGAETAMTA
jgi:predicted amidohydrolase YtcJ